MIQPLRGGLIPPLSPADPSPFTCPPPSPALPLMLQSLHPLLVHMVQPQQSHPLWGQSEDLCLLLEPLAQLLQVKKGRGSKERAVGGGGFTGQKRLG